ncbi:MAG: hypothetical protein PHS79_00255 [Patescibacteria group bacterium]|nr:hypothetical protein [Patescibacteria group bacterium]
MQKKWFWPLGLIIILIIGGVVLWQIEKNRDIVGSLTDKQHPSLNDCAQAEYPFACFLDRTMNANDPNLCADAGAEKRVDCLKAYAEIKVTEIDCSRILSPDFQLECQMEIQPSNK